MWLAKHVPLDRWFETEVIRKSSDIRDFYILSD